MSDSSSAPPSAGRAGPASGPGGRRTVDRVPGAVVAGTLLVASLGLALLGAPGGRAARGDGALLTDEPYGTHPRQVVDLWLPAGPGPHPLVLWLHGGGFATGNKDDLADDRRRRLLAAGLAVAAVEYRLTPEVSFPSPHLDVARALQTLRHRATLLEIDPERAAALGHSAGGGIALWLAFRDDLADPGAADPVARRSTRLAAVVALDAQSAYDPFFAAEIGLPRLERHPFFRPFYGLGPNEPIDTPRLRRLYRRASAVSWLTPDDPPVWLGYRRADLLIGPATRLRDIVHHPRFGLDLCRRMRALEIECVVSYRGRDRTVTPEDWLARRLAGS